MPGRQLQGQHAACADRPSSIAQPSHCQGRHTPSRILGGNKITPAPLFNGLLMVLNNSQIIANAQKGHGGDIMIRAGQLIRSSDSVIRAASEESVSGTITITAPNTDVVGSLVVLPET